jgi:hypothetical protein
MPTLEQMGDTWINVSLKTVSFAPGDATENIQSAFLFVRPSGKYQVKIITILYHCYKIQMISAQ